MIKYSLILILFSSLFVGCLKSYDHTSKVCEGSLSVEVYFSGLIGLKEEYLSDSINFRMYVGDRDEEHQNYNYTCDGDSLFIKKLDVLNDMTGHLHVIETRVFRISELKKQKRLIY